MARRVAVAFVGSLVLAGLSWSTGRAEPRPPEPEDGPSVYIGVVDAAGLDALLAISASTATSWTCSAADARPASSRSR